MGREASSPQPVVVDLWLTRIAGPTLPLHKHPSEYLSPSERERWQRLVRAESRDAFLASRCYLRAVLAGYLGIAPAAVPLVVDRRGKPRLDDGGSSGYQFTLSHAGGWTIVAVTTGVAVGVDLEPLRPVRDALAIARRFFPPSDHDLLAALPAEPRAAAFLVSWTLKEALAKADGRGIALLSQLVTGVEPLPEPGRTSAVDGRPYVLASLEAPPGLVGAVAAAGESIALRRFGGGEGALNKGDALTRRG